MDLAECPEEKRMYLLFRNVRGIAAMISLELFIALPYGSPVLIS